jgi:hypothetical protein
MLVLVLSLTRMRAETIIIAEQSTTTSTVHPMQVFTAVQYYPQRATTVVGVPLIAPLTVNHRLYRQLTIHMLRTWDAIHICIATIATTPGHLPYLSAIPTTSLSMSNQLTICILV